MEGYKQKSDAIKAAVEVYELDDEGNRVSEELKKKLIGELGFRYEDVMYESYAGEDEFVKSSYLYDLLGGQDKELILDTLLKGRIESMTGKLLASNGVLVDLREKGVITNDEYKWLIKQKFSASGEEIGKSSYEESKLKKIAIKTPKSTNAKFKPAKTTVKISAPQKAGTIKLPEVTPPSMEKLIKMYSPESKIKVRSEDLTPPKLTIKY